MERWKLLQFDLGFGPGDSWSLTVNSGLRWNPPHDHEEISAEEHQRILTLIIREALAVMGDEVFFFRR